MCGGAISQAVAPGECDNGAMTDRPTTFSAEELAEVAAGLRALLGAVETGELVADAGTVPRLDGAAVALEALARGDSLPRF